MAQERCRATDLAAGGQAEAFLRSAFGLHLGHFDLFLHI